MNHRQHINERIRIHRCVYLPVVTMWFMALSITSILYYFDSFAIFFTKPSCFILTILVFAGYVGGGPRCPECGDDLRSLASRFERAFRWKRLPETITTCPNCLTEFNEPW